MVTDGATHQGGNTESEELEERRLPLCVGLGAAIGLSEMLWT